MDFRSVLLAMLPVGLTLISYAIVRDMLWGILLGNKSKKTALRLKGEAKGFSRFSQRYMKDHLTKYQKDYKTWMTVKLLLVILTVLQIAGFTTMILMDVKFWIVAVVCGVFVLFNIILFMIMMTKTETSTNKRNTKGSPWKFEQ